MSINCLWRSVALSLLFLAGSFSTPVSKAADERAELLGKMDAQAQHYGELSRRIWENPEVGYKEQQSSELLKAELRTNGFQLQENVAEIPTAFVASYGSGKPVIGI